MANVPPRGLHARHASTWKTPLSVWARVSGAWTTAQYVWVRTGGAWQIIWSSGATAAATATATWVAPHSVRIDWTLPVPSTTTEWIVRRSDGSEVGRVVGSATTLTDPSPKISNTGTAPTANTLSYTVVASDGVNESSRATNTITVSLDPATVTPTASYPSSASNSVATLNVSWTPHATYGEPDYWQVYIGSSPVGTKLAGSIRSASFTGALGRGSQYNIRVVPFMQLADGSVVQAGNYSTTLNLNVTPNIPRNLVLSNSVGGQLCLTFNGPAAGVASSYNLERYVASTGPWTTWATVTTGGPHCFVASVAHYARVRTVAPGGVSDWVQVGPVTPVTDTTGPVASTVDSWQPEASYGRMVVRGRWSSSPDVAQGWVYMDGGAGWTLIWNGPVSASASFAVELSGWSAGQTAKVLLQTRDALGNIGVDVVREYGPLLASPVEVDPSDGGTGRGGVWRTDGIGGGANVLQGMTTAGENTGYLFYGNNLYDIIAKPGRTTTAIELDLYRVNDQGSGACINPRIWVHGELAKPPTPPGYGDGGVERLLACMARNVGFGPAEVRVTLPNDFIAYIQAGYRGFAFNRPSGVTNPDDPNSYYMKMGPVPSGNGVVVMGHVRIHHLG